MILGLTGAIGSGKSAVLAAFSTRNWKIVDADRLCHQVYENASGDFVDKLKDLFGNNCVTANGAVDRKMIARSVFNDKCLLNKLEDLIFPEIERELTNFILQCKIDDVNAVCEIPLLFEKKWNRYFDAVIGIWTPDCLRHKRLKEFRNMSNDDIKMREANQFTPEKKIELADYCIVNDGNLEDIDRQIKELLKMISVKYCK